MSEAYIYDGIRTPFGKYGGVLANVRPDTLLALTIKSLVDRNTMKSNILEDVIAGNTNQAGEDSRNIARNAALLAGLPTSVAGITVNRLCGSGLAAVLDAARAIRCNEGELFIACGVESMSRSPLVIAKADSAYSRNQLLYDSTLGWRFPNKDLTNIYGDESNTDTAENIAKELGISRNESDKFAMASQQKYEKAKKKGFYQEEILAIETPGINSKDPAICINEDEHPRPETTLDKLGALKPLTEGGVVTAGNASGINDGAVALLIGDRNVGDSLGLKPRARILGGAVSGVEPRLMGLGPVPSSKKLLDRLGLKLEEMDVIEINEAFASQVLGCLKNMNITYDDKRVNPNGGAIAIGHPLGASGARLALTALRQLENIDGKYALLTMCIGIGQGISTIIERLD